MIFSHLLLKNLQQVKERKSNFDIGNQKWNNQKDNHPNILHSINILNLDMPYNLLIMVHYILNKIHHMLVFGFLIFLKKNERRRRKGKKKKRERNYDDRKYHLYIQNLSIPKWKYKMLKSITMENYNLNIHFHWDQNILNIDYYKLFIYLINFFTYRVEFIFIQIK